MKKLIIIIMLCFLAIINSVAQRSVDNVPGWITFNKAIPCDSVLIYIGDDSTSWDLGRTHMVEVFSDDSKNWAYKPTLTENGNQVVKIIYYPTGGDSAFFAGTWYNDYVELDTTILASVGDVAQEVLDTMGIYLTIIGGSKSHAAKASNCDSIFIINTSGDTTDVLEYWHVGGSSGDFPDSVVGIDW